MKLITTQDIVQFLKMYIPSLALGTALELEIFSHLSKKPQNADKIAEITDIPIHRTRALLELLTKLGLLEKENEMYEVSTITQKAILKTYSTKTWAFFAEVFQNNYPLLNNLTDNISLSDNLWNNQSIKPPDWFEQLKNNPEYARKFTYGLYEYHLSFAKKFAQIFDISGVEKLMDIGGGSGVISLELLKHHSQMLS